MNRVIQYLSTFRRRKLSKIYQKIINHKEVYYENTDKLNYSTYLGTKYVYYVQYELIRYPLDIIMFPVTIAHSFYLESPKRELFKHFMNLGFFIIPFFHVKFHLYYNYITLNKLTPTPYLLDQNIEYYDLKYKKEIEKNLEMHANNYIDYVLTRLEEDLYNKNSSFKIFSYNILNTYLDWLKKNNNGIDEQFLNSLNYGDINRVNSYFRIRVRYRLMNPDLIYSFIVLNGRIPSTPLTHIYTMTNIYYYDNIRDIIKRYELIKFIEYNIEKDIGLHDKLLSKFKIRRSVPLTLTTILYSLLYINKRNIRKLDNIKLHFERKEYIKNRKNKPLEGVEGEQACQAVEPGAGRSVDQVRKEDNEKIVECIDHLNFILQRVEVRVDLLKELTLMFQDLEKFDSQVNHLMRMDSETNPHDAQRHINKILADTNALEKRILILSESSEVNKDNITKEITQFRSLIKTES